jgi:hypothetical protein
MKTQTEIFFNEELIETVNNILPLNVNDLFYFSLRGTTPRSEKDYHKKNEGYKTEFINEVIDKVNKSCEGYHIRTFKVDKIIKSYDRSYNIEITTDSDINVTFNQTIFVSEIDNII